MRLPYWGPTQTTTVIGILVTRLLRFMCLYLLVVTRLRPGCVRGLGSVPGRGYGLISAPKTPENLWNLPSPVTNGYRGAQFLLVKRPEREPKHLPQPSTEFKVESSYNFTTPPTPRKCRGRHLTLLKIQNVTCPVYSRI